MDKQRELTQARLKELLDYDPDSGIFTWLVSRGNVRAGTVISNTNKDGYICIKVSGKQYKAHRIAWLFVYGVWPKNEIDHKDTIRNHNWIDNLRDVTKSGNQQNLIKARCDNKTGLLGVSYHQGKYQSAIKIDRKNIHLGIFSTPEEAHQAYISAKRMYHPNGML